VFRIQQCRRALKPRMPSTIYELDQVFPFLFFLILVFITLLWAAWQRQPSDDIARDAVSLSYEERKSRREAAHRRWPMMAPLYGCGGDAALTRPTASKPHMAPKPSHGIRQSHDDYIASPACVQALEARSHGGDGIPRRPPGRPEGGGLHRCPFFFFARPDGPEWTGRISGNRPAGPNVCEDATLWTGVRCSTT
jgi:hypothetical protein